MMCPTCNSQLVLRQINLNTAVYLCEIKTCSYPEGHDWILVNRDFDNILNQNDKAVGFVKETENDTTDNMEWLENICNQGVENLQSTDDTAQSEELSAIYNEILKELDLNNSNVKPKLENPSESAFEEFNMLSLDFF